MLEILIVAGAAAVLFFGFSQKPTAPPPLGGFGPSKPAPTNTGTLDVVTDSSGVQRFSDAAQTATLQWLSGEGLVPTQNPAFPNAMAFLVSMNADPSGSVNAAGALQAMSGQGSQVYLYKDRSQAVVAPLAAMMTPFGVGYANEAKQGGPLVCLFG